MKIGFFELEGWEEPIIKELLPDDELFFSKDKIFPEMLSEKNDFDIVSVFVNSKMDAKSLGYFPNLKMISTRSTGYDHLDLDYCAQKGIAPVFVPGYGNNTVAEYAFGLLLNLTRKMYMSIDQLKETGSFNLAGMRGIDLNGKTMGIIGTGRIGKIAIKIAKGFGMNVIAYDPFPDENYAKEAGYSYVSLEDLLKNSDAISIHVPYTKETHHLINKNNIGLIKKGVYLINTARGGIVETDALVKALESGILAGAGLDVLEEEGETKDEMFFMREGNPREEKMKTVIENHILMKMPNVLITPHNAFNTNEALERILRTTLDTIKSFKEGKIINEAKKI